MKGINGTWVFAAACWASWFVLTWLLIFDIPLGSMAKGIWIVFFILGVLGSSYVTKK